MTDLAKDFRAQLSQCARSAGATHHRRCRCRPMAPASGSSRRMPPRPSRWSTSRSRVAARLCISSQVGCALDCSFCSTAQQGFNRNLTTAEIVGQVWLAARELEAAVGAAAGDDPDADANFEADPGSEDAERRRCAGGHAASGRIISNVVLMGMGEPLANFRNVVPALSILLDDFGFDLSRRRVTLSTSGLVPQMYKLAEDDQCRAGRLAACSQRCAAQRAGADQPQASHQRAAGGLLALSR